MRFHDRADAREHISVAGGRARRTLDVHINAHLALQTGDAQFAALWRQQRREFAQRRQRGDERRGEHRAFGEIGEARPAALDEADAHAGPGAPGMKGCPPAPRAPSGDRLRDLRLHPAPRQGADDKVALPGQHRHIGPMLQRAAPAAPKMAAHGRDARRACLLQGDEFGPLAQNAHPRRLTRENEGGVDGGALKGRHRIAPGPDLGKIKRLHARRGRREGAARGLRTGPGQSVNALHAAFS